MVKNLRAMQENQVQFLGPEDPQEKGNGHPFRCSCLENPMDRGAWWAAVHGVAKSQTPLSDFHSIRKDWKEKKQWVVYLSLSFSVIIVVFGAWQIPGSSVSQKDYDRIPW